MNYEKNKLTIFLSHSHKDIDKVRKLREILESLDFEPLIFFLQCLDDNNDELEDFIKREIDARRVFIYCKSKNAENSAWVQKELEYIKQSNIKRLHTIDIDLPFNESLVSLLESLCNIIKRNTVFVSCSHADQKIYESVRDMLVGNGYKVITHEAYFSADTEETYEEQYQKYIRQLQDIIKNGIFLPIITHNHIKSLRCGAELEAAMAYGNRSLIVPLIVNFSLRNARKMINGIFDCESHLHAFEFDGGIQESDREKITAILQDLPID